MSLKETVLALVFISQLTFEVTPASPAHIHSHHLNKEREEDGSYIPRDHNHIKDGAHRTEFDHESILGSVKEAEEYDHLTPEESKKKLKMLVEVMDLNQDSVIDRQELHSWILRSLRLLSEEESSERFIDVDENEDGVVTWEEYKADTYDIDDVTPDNEELLFIQKDKIMFNAADHNKDEILDKQEFFKLSHPEDHPEMMPYILQNTLDDKDLDKNGVIDFQEFIGERAKNNSKEWLLTEKQRFDHEFDKDGDGILNPSEIIAWVVPSNEDIAEEEVDHLFAASDENHDNLLTVDEIVDKHEIFVGSEATDYGEQLHNIQFHQDEL